ncbi:MAG: hypothetical protein PHE27_08590 [Alphaproteobacteria bacterium]|nr:hypothetical protein [Alphaproteobacteria bacterium]
MTDETQTKTPLSPPCSSSKGPFVWFLSIALVLVCIGGLALIVLTKTNVVSSVRTEAADVEALSQRVDVLEKQFNALVQVSPSPSENGVSVSLGEELKRLKEQVEGSEDHQKQIAQSVVASAFAFWDLREAAMQGRPFALQLETLRVSAVGDSVAAELMSRLALYAEKGVPTLASLRETLILEEKNAPAESEASRSLWTRVKAFLRPLISFGRVHDSRFADLEKALGDGDAVRALEASKALPDNILVQLTEWRALLQTRVDFENAMKSLAARFLASPVAPLMEAPGASESIVAPAGDAASKDSAVPAENETTALPAEQSVAPPEQGKAK